ncbi:unnamed protein product [marine sediment metagenome]|uniref:Uncharacterized protein n=1 Tax=marine sediment metagenome TaxID=412755 RepID=X0WB07_9ZZZZ
MIHSDYLVELGKGGRGVPRGVFAFMVAAGFSLRREMINPVATKSKEKGGIDEGSRYGLYSLSKGNI